MYANRCHFEALWDISSPFFHDLFFLSFEVYSIFPYHCGIVKCVCLCAFTHCHNVPFRVRQLPGNNGQRTLGSFFFSLFRSPSGSLTLAHGRSVSFTLFLSFTYCHCLSLTLCKAATSPHCSSGCYWH